MRIVLDAMGTDQRPGPDVAGAVLAAREFGDPIILVGDEVRIQAELAKHNTHGLPLQVVHTPDEIAMGDRPTQVVKAKEQSSIHIGMGLVKDGQADAFVTMGNTGAAQAIATLNTLRRIPGVKRPALAALYPVSGKQVIVLDVGANADSRPEWLVQFAIMGAIYAETAMSLQRPRIATLSNGEEEGKGNQLIRDTQALLKHLSLNYVGHVEPYEIVQNKADVIVMDGFVGNIFLKTFEGSIRYFGGLLRQEVMRNLVGQVGGLLLRGAFKRVQRYFDTDAIGGTPLLGVNGVVIIGHGSSSPRAIKSAIGQARMAVQGATVSAIQQGLAHYTEQLQADAALTDEQPL